jgi:hypothetical protein
MVIAAAFRVPVDAGYNGGALAVRLPSAKKKPVRR